MDRKLEMDAYHHLLRTVEHLTQASNAGVRKQGLTPSRLGVIVALHEHGSRTPKELAQAIMRSPGNLTLVLDNMVRDGIVHRETDTKDRRRVLITLSDTGRKLATKMVPAFRDRVSRALAVLAERDVDTLVKICAKLAPIEVPAKKTAKIDKTDKTAKVAAKTTAKTTNKATSKAKNKAKIKVTVNKRGAKRR